MLLFGPCPTIEVDPAHDCGVVRDASTGEPIAGARIQTVGFYGDATTDRHGRYRILRTENMPYILVSVAPRDHDRYLSVVRRFDNAKAYSEDPAMSEKLKEFVRQSIDEELPAEERLKGLSAEEVAAALPPEVLAALARKLQANGSSSKPQ